MFLAGMNSLYGIGISSVCDTLVTFSIGVISLGRFTPCGQVNLGHLVTRYLERVLYEV